MSISGQDDLITFVLPFKCRHSWISLQATSPFDSIPTKYILPIGFFNPVIPTQNFVQSRNLEGCFRYSPPAHTFNQESRPNFAFQFQIPRFKWGKSWKAYWKPEFEGWAKRAALTSLFAWRLRVTSHCVLQIENLLADDTLWIQLTIYYLEFKTTKITWWDLSSANPLLNPLLSNKLPSHSLSLYEVPIQRAWNK